MSAAVFGSNYLASKAEFSVTQSPSFLNTTPRALFRSWQFVVVITAVSSAFVTVGCEKAASSKAKSEAGEVKTVAVVRGESFAVQPSVWPTTVRCQGSLFAEEVAVVGAKVPGRVTEVFVDLGDVVTADQPLVQIDQQEFRLLVSQAQAQWTQSRSAVGMKAEDNVNDLNPDNAPPVREARAVWDEAKQAITRLRALSQGDAISDSDLEIAEAAERVAAARYTSAQNSVREKIALIGVQTAALELAQQRLVETTIKAPFAGIVQSRSLAPGTYVQAGQSLITIAKVSTLRFRGSVPERYAQRLQIGQKLKIVSDLGKQTREVTVSRISPTIDPMNRSLVFEADIDNADGKLRSGLFAEAMLDIDPNAQAIVIPTESLVRFAGVDKVWTVVDGMLKEQVVSVGRIDGDRVEITQGLVAGTQLLKRARDGKVAKFESGSPESTKSDAEATTTSEKVSNSAAKVGTLSK